MPEILNHKLYLKLTSVENPVTLVLTAAEQVNGSSARECKDTQGLDRWYK